MLEELIPFLIYLYLYIGLLPLNHFHQLQIFAHYMEVM